VVVSVHVKTTRAYEAKRVLIEAAQADSDDGDGAGAGYERNGHRSRIRTITRTHFASPPHGQGTRGCQHIAQWGEMARRIADRGTPSRRALALHGVSG
jgi:hypothetical protein